jgi:TfoX/Sxy family transcriptional regulator of competence genes
MMGEYILYYKGKIFGGIYDNRFLVKPVEAAKMMMPDAPLEVPYPGGKKMLLVEEIDNREFLKTLVESMFSDL